VYAASKHTIIGLTKVAALEVATVGIRVNAVFPAVTYPEMLERVQFESGLSPEDSAAGHPTRLAE
jgi:NAD(P)-dependent dehydrogenase (short-subunit alcohol dehydrogenase family)